MTIAPPDPLIALQRLRALDGADPAALAEAAPKARWVSLAPGETAIDFGDLSTDVFLVAEGTVRVVLRTTSGQEVIFGDLGAGQFFGEMAALDGAPRSASVTALHQTRLCRLPGEAFVDIALRSPPIGLRLLRMLVGRLRTNDERLVELAALPVKLRLGAELLRLSRRRGEDAAGERVVSPPLPQHVLAARIGARREAVSRELGALARDGLVEVTPRAITLPRPEVLRALIDAELRDAAARPERLGLP
ncbi:Crp/Fnr family transcriptional regulator [Falsiroseomonas oryzae]|uniref:Crp/Fnr family transcriptional regulator n=1 Tax=Falsiroseomonas oryzae TaxID=2766473 RepID=UPI0022EA3D88|nr:Crp/Fnr family transcriptional regulator [Roseomonas sp. MO-31]